MGKARLGVTKRRATPRNDGLEQIESVCFWWTKKSKARKIYKIYKECLFYGVRTEVVRVVFYSASKSASAADF